MLFHFAYEAAGAIGAPGFPAPSDLGGTNIMHRLGRSRRGNQRACMFWSSPGLSRRSRSFFFVARQSRGRPGRLARRRALRFCPAMTA